MPIKPVTPLLKLNKASANLANLHMALKAAGFTIAKSEVTKRIAGPSTIDALNAVRALRNIPPSASTTLDNDTADAVNSILNERGLIARQLKFTVSGRVLNKLGEGIGGKTVVAFDVDLKGARIYRNAKTIGEVNASGGMELLEKTVSHPDGSYTITFTREQFAQAEIGLADVVVYVVDEINIKGRSRLTTVNDYTNNRDIRNLDVILLDSIERGLSEYARLMAILDPFVKESGLQLPELSDSTDQIVFLATETNQDRWHTYLAVQSAKLAFADGAARYKFNPELFYGLGRQRIVLSWASLQSLTEEGLVKALKKSIAGNIIGPYDIQGNGIRSFIKNLRDFAAAHSVTAPETADLYKLLGFSTTDITLQKTLAQTYLQFSGEPKEFWNSLREKGISKDLISSLQLTNQLSIITGQHTALIEELLINRGIRQAEDLLALDIPTWTNIIAKTGFPSTVPGNSDPERSTNYILGIQNILNISFATQKIALMLKNNEIPTADAVVRDKVSTFLATAKGFDFNSSRIVDFDPTIKDIAGDKQADVRSHLQLIQRIYLVSPTPDAMRILISRGYTSAFHISSISQNAFIASEADSLGSSDIAFAVYNRARQQVMRAQHTVLKMRDAMDTATPSKIISADQKAAISKLLLNY
jgi:hypothetical protein